MEDDREPLLLREGKRYGGKRGIRAEWKRITTKGERKREGEKGKKKTAIVGNSKTAFIRMIRRA